MDTQYSVTYNTNGTGVDQVRTAALIRWQDGSAPVLLASVTAYGPNPVKKTSVHLLDIEAVDVPTALTFLNSSRANNPLTMDLNSISKLKELFPDLEVEIRVKNGKNTIRTSEWATAAKLAEDLDDGSVKVQIPKKE